MSDINSVRQDIQKLLDKKELTPGQEALLNELRAEYKELLSAPPPPAVEDKELSIFGAHEQRAMDELTFPKDAPPHPWISKSADELMKLKRSQPQEFMRFIFRHQAAMTEKVGAYYRETFPSK